ncbi:alpha/beta hydrolase [Kytococcus sp. Marseille-QA3725]
MHLTTPRAIALALSSALALGACGQATGGSVEENTESVSAESSGTAESGSPGDSSSDSEGGSGEESATTGSGDESSDEMGSGTGSPDGRSPEDETSAGEGASDGTDEQATGTAPTGDPEQAPGEETSADASTPTDSAPEDAAPTDSAPEDTAPTTDAPVDTAPTGSDRSSPAEDGGAAPTDGVDGGEASLEPAPTEGGTSAPVPGESDESGSSDGSSETTPSESSSGPSSTGAPSPSSSSGDDAAPEPGVWGDWVSYGSSSDQRYKMLPGEPGKDVVVLVHGGGWVGGDAASFTDESSRKNEIVQRLHSQGLWVATVEYRKADQSEWPATADDVHDGVTAAVGEARDGGAGQQVGLFGDSSGGHLAALEAVQHPGTVDAVVGYFGIYDPLTAKAQRKDMSCPPATAAEDHLLMHDATDPAVRDRLEETASPAALATSEAPPMFMLHGTADCVAPAEQSRQMHQALQAKGVNSKLEVVKGADHSQPAFWTEDRYLSQVTSWMAVNGVD